MALKIGADPELFVKKAGVFQSAYGLIPGTKDWPFPVEKGAVQIDGTALEFNIDPAETVGEFKHNIHAVMKTLRDMIPPEYEFAIEPVAMYDMAYLADQPEEALALGCTPDFSAYTLQPNQPPDQHPVMRTAAGHIHMGWTEGQHPLDVQHFDNCCSVIKEADYYVGLPSLILDPDNTRKEMYGKAGAFRPKRYGAEYRTPSNYWLKSDKLMELVFNNIHMAYDSFINGCKMYSQFVTTAKDIIDNNDREAAIKFCERQGIPCAV